MLRETLMQGADEGGNSLAVVLTPGPFNETYFEHAFLARHLGLPLVQGQDLTVRSDTVYLKTLAGLRRVHAILRRMDDDYCDSLELRPDSALGVPGMLGAVRAGRVRLANGLGSGLLESAAWQGFLPGASQWLLGEPLKLPSVATWWCGERPALDYVVTHLDQLVVKATYPNQKFEPCFGRTLEGAERTALIRRLRARPYAYVAQERVSLSQAPSWRAGGNLRLAPRALTMRVFAVATAHGYQVMPGGLARIAAEGAVDIVSTQRGGGSKDVWLLADTAQPAAGPEAAALGEAGLPRRIRHDELPSQLVENLYWLGRYSERCEDKARLVRATLAMRTNETVWRRARQQCIDYGVLPEAGDPAMTVFDDAHEFGLSADLGRLSWCATQSRSRLSAEHWRSISLMQSQFQEAGAARSDPLEALDRLLVALTSLSGFALDDMTQDDGWRLLMLGRRLERVQFLATLLSDRLSPGLSIRQGELEWLLDVGGVSITYRTRYVSSPKLAPVLQLLVFDDSSPRALCFQWTAILNGLEDLARSTGASPEDPFGQAIAQLVEATASIAGAEEDSDADIERRQRMSHALAELASAAARASDRLVSRHFSLVELDLQTVAS
jgi:uncharacterized alpha-E superfamily protein